MDLSLIDGETYPKCFNISSSECKAYFTKKKKNNGKIIYISMAWILKHFKRS